MAHLPKRLAPPISDDLGGRVSVAGECFDWLDHDTRALVLEAIELHDNDDINEWVRYAVSPAFVPRPKNAYQMGRLRLMTRKAQNKFAAQRSG